VIFGKPLNMTCELARCAVSRLFVSCAVFFSAVVLYAV
jgi:hypothetical protein